MKGAHRVLFGFNVGAVEDNVAVDGPTNFNTRGGCRHVVENLRVFYKNKNNKVHYCLIETFGLVLLGYRNPAYVIERLQVPWSSG